MICGLNAFLAKPSLHFKGTCLVTHDMTAKAIATPVSHHAEPIVIVLFIVASKSLTDLKFLKGWFEW
mgnify:CR=1 FL=1